jgi:hypothetical protein
MESKAARWNVWGRYSHSMLGTLNKRLMPRAFVLQHLPSLGHPLFVLSRLLPQIPIPSIPIPLKRPPCFTGLACSCIAGGWELAERGGLEFSRRPALNVHTLLGARCVAPPETPSVQHSGRSDRSRSHSPKSCPFASPCSPFFAAGPLCSVSFPLLPRPGSLKGPARFATVSTPRLG